MKNKICIFYLFLFQGVLLIAQAPDLQWSKTFGGSDNDDAWKIIESEDTGFFVGGDTRSSDGDLDIHFGGRDFWISKINNDGEIIWDGIYGGSLSDEFTCIVYTNDGGLIAGGYTYSNDGDVFGNHGNTDYWIIKIDAIGNIEWQKTYGGSNTDILRSIILTTDGGFILVGDSQSDDGDINDHHGSTLESDFWVIKINSVGEIEWERSLGGSDDDEPGSVLLTSEGSYLISGWTKSVDGDVSFNHGNRDIWLVKLDVEGNILWEKTYGGSGNDYSYSSAKTFNHGFIFSGSTESNDGNVSGYHGGFYDVWIVKTDSIGNLEWSKTYGGSDEEQSYDIIQTVDSNFSFTGYSFSSDDDVLNNYGEDDAWVVKIDSLGNLIWQLSLGGTDRDQLYSIIAADEDTYMLAGATLSTDGDITINQGETDFWVVRIGPPCTPLLLYADADGDGFGDIANDSVSCFELTGFVLDSTDCNDADLFINPAAPEICNGLDDNCNTDIDEGLTIYTFFADADGDGFGNMDVVINSCMEIIAGYVLNSTDCDDANNSIYPGAEELCNYLDDDCDGIVDDNLTYIHSYQDADGDDFGNIEIDSLACTIPDGFVEDDSDCDDTNPANYPGAEETLNGVDDNCNELIDEGLAIENNLLSEIKIYPNPANDILQIDYSGNETGEIEILNIAGENIYSDKITAHLTINIHDFPAGIYLLKIVSTESQGVFNFVKD